MEFYLEFEYNYSINLYGACMRR